MTDSAPAADFSAAPSAWGQVPRMTRTPVLGHTVGKCSSSPITKGPDGGDEDLLWDGCCSKARPYSDSCAHDPRSSKLRWQSCLSTEGREGGEILASGC